MNLIMLKYRDSLSELAIEYILDTMKEKFQDTNHTDAS